MAKRTKIETIRSRIWQEEAEADNPFAAKTCHCAGYDVYGDLLGNARWAEYLFLLFQRQAPLPWQANLLEDVALILANPGPRDLSVRAAMNGGVGQSTSASCLIAALAVGAGQNGGAHELALALQGWQQCGLDLKAWQSWFDSLNDNERADIWPEMEHFPGFDPHGISCASPVLQALRQCCTHSTEGEGALSWLQKNRQAFEQVAHNPLSMLGVAATAFYDLGFTPQQSEMLYLLLRLPGAAAHALEQMPRGWIHYPFFADGLQVENDPGSFSE
ncbi:MAG: citryl-CoA lyase [Gammaproteobacteria bacterium]|nr:citryl-CoA lyase [Gammaproteobacteria bacterium]